MTMLTRSGDDDDDVGWTMDNGSYWWSCFIVFLAGKYVEIKVDSSGNIRNIEFHNTRWRVSHAYNQSINQSINKALA